MLMEWHNDIHSAIDFVRAMSSFAFGVIAE